MTLYEFKMYLKRSKFIKKILARRENNEDFSKVKQLKENGARFIFDIEDALKNQKLVFFADYGTLLGIIRDNNFIQWDNDVDYGIVVNDLFDWKLFEENLCKHGFTKVREFKLEDRIKEQTYSKDNLTVDFFSYEIIKEEMIGYSFFRKEDYIYHSKDEFHVRMYKYIKVEKTKQIDFLNTKVHVPENAEDYLECLYTSEWRIPNPNWTEDDESSGNMEILNKLGYGHFIN